MTVVRAGLLAQFLLVVAGVAVVGVLPQPWRDRIAAGVAVASGGAGCVTGAAAWSGVAGSVTVPLVLPGWTLDYAPDRLGGAFLVLAGVVGALAGLAGLAGAGADGVAGSRTGWSAFLLFLLGLQGVFAAADVPAFLLAWEAMAAASTVLVLVEHRERGSVLPAGLWYAVLTHLSFLLVLIGFGTLSAAAHGTGFAALARLDPFGPHATAVAAGTVAAVLGLVAKAGAVPLHVWLPKAHPEAPSHVSALLSAAMVKAGVYGLLLLLVRLLPAGPAWWGLGVLALGAASAVFGILQAAVATDLKRLLAYSTTENIGLILAAIGVAHLLTTGGVRPAAHVALVAAVMLTFGHAAAKAGLFLAAGGVVHATGERDLDRLGGLARRMPWTATAFGVCALGAAALPLTAGFAAEWMLLQSLVRAGRPADPAVAMAVPVTVTVIALTAGLALLTMVKAFGIAFLGRPRSAPAGAAHDPGWAQRAAMITCAVLVLALGLLPGPVATASAAALGLGGVTSAGWFGVRIAAFGTLLDPLALLGLGAGSALVIAAAVARAARRAPRRRVDLGWGCGGARVSPRMQYTASSYAEPMVRVFDHALAASRSVDAVPAGPAPYLEQEVRFRQQVTDVVEARAYRPLLAAAWRVGEVARRVQNGSINRYLGFSFAALLVVLAVVTR